MADPFGNERPTLNGPATQDLAVVTSDSVDLTTFSRALWVGTGGDVAILLVGSGSVKTYKNVPSGTLLPFRVKRVYTTNTTAADMIAVL